MTAGLSYLRGEIWLINSNPNKGKEPGKIRPALIVQSNYLNEEHHPTCIVCPISSQFQKPNLLRIPIFIAGLKKESFILIDQIRSVDVEKRFLKMIGMLPIYTLEEVDRSLKLLLDLSDR